MSTAAAPDRKFFLITSRNQLDSNLTELNAADQVDRGYTSHNDWLAHTARYAHVAKYLGRLMGSGKTVNLLDVGMGDMNLPKWLWRNRIKVTEYWGVDLRAKHEWLEEISWKVPMNVARADVVLDRGKLIEVAKWPSTFDVTVCFETFEHVPRDQAPTLMQNLFSWTRPGGICFFSTPNGGVSDSVAGNHVGSDGVVREWSYQDKLDLAKETGFEVEATFGTFCGIRRLPPEAFNDPVVKAAKRFLHHSWFTVFVAAAYPQYSNNSLFVMRRPLQGANLEPMPKGPWLSTDSEGIEDGSD